MELKSEFMQLWDVSAALLESTCDKSTWLDMIWIDTPAYISS